ncbi:CLUMA_CG006952, isoform A [Clunio marinus]|uniref:CLUMA_CG006952, isoform A n=1 Tax=Clunio marinus TaxID=568069 RepID=A0A1J1HZ87_9DIPT|nr:CLUMA_CG006952, isoform A [Clunio marinus]
MMFDFLTACFILDCYNCAVLIHKYIAVEISSTVSGHKSLLMPFYVTPVTYVKSFRNEDEEAFLIHDLNKFSLLNVAINCIELLLLFSQKLILVKEVKEVTHMMRLTSKHSGTLLIARTCNPWK